MSPPKYDTIEKYVDWGDQTVTVDPIRTEFHIRHHGDDDRHLDAVDKGREKRRIAYNKTLAALRSMEPTKAFVRTYLPSVTELQSMPTVLPSGMDPLMHHGETANFNHLYSKRGSSVTDSRRGQRPAIEQLHRDSLLPDTSKGGIERMLYQSQHAIDQRVFER